MARLLLVDDDHTALDMLRRALEADGHAVTAIADSGDARAAFAASPQAFDVLVTDISMPSVDGITLAEGALAIRPELAVIMMSGLADELARAEAIKSTMVQVVSKPLPLDRIRAMVRAATAR